MAIRVQHGDISDFAALGALAGQAAKAEKEAERADRQRLALMDIQARQALANKEMEVKVQMAEDAMDFEREMADNRRRFEASMAMQREANDFQRNERKRMEEQEKFDAAMNAIDARDDFSPEEKDNMKLQLQAERAGTPLPTQALFGAEDQKTTLELSRLATTSDRLGRRVQQLQETAGEFSTETKGFFRKTKQLVRQQGKQKRKATPDEAAMYQRMISEINDTMAQKSLVDTKINSMLKVSPDDVSSRAEDLATMERPDSEAERLKVYKELRTLGKEDVAKALFRSWEQQDEEETSTQIVNNNQSSFSKPKPKRVYNNQLSPYGMTQSMGSFR